VRGVNIIKYLKNQKWEIMIFIIIFVLLFISSYLLIGGPKSIGGPIGVFLGFCFVQFLKYRDFKKNHII